MSIIIKCPLGTWHNDNFGGKKLDHKGTHACTIKIGPHMLGGVTALLTTSIHSCVSTWVNCLEWITLIRVVWVSNLQIISCPSAVRSSSPLTIHCNHCVFSVIFRELARVRPLYDTVNFNCLGLSALTPVQPPEGTRELTEGAYRIEWEKATVVHFRSGSGMTAHSQLFWQCREASRYGILQAVR